MKYKVITALILFFMVQTCANADNIRKFSSIEFKGLNYLTKYEIINKLNFKIASDGIAVNLDELDKYLKNNKLVNTYNVITDNDKIIIVITENEPAYLFLLKKGSVLVPFETDIHFKLLSSNRIHGIRLPVIISEKEINSNDVSEKTKQVINVINNVSIMFPVLYNQIRELDMTGEYLKIKLYGRVLDITVKPTVESFKKLNYSIGYFDSIGIYPRAIAILESPAILQ